MYLLGIETSCDETSASIVENGKRILSNIVVNQVEDHSVFNGVVPEIASRMHLEKINHVIDKAFHYANINYSKVSGVGVVYKPGLIGSLLVGISTAKAFAFSYDIPLIPINHIEAHLYSVHLEHDIPFPNIGLVLSGGHTLIFKSYSFTEHKLIGSTIDDAIGEAFDKVAKFFNLGYPGGPVIDKIASKGNEYAFSFPIPKFKDKSGYRFSYSGLKTAVIHQRDKFWNKNYDNSLENILASFQKSAFDLVIKASVNLCDELSIKNLVITGGVSCNSYLKKRFSELSNINTYFPSNKLSGDNAAMVAGLSYHLLEKNITSDLSLNALSKIVKQGKLIN